MQEPLYSVKRLKSSYKYRYDILDAFIGYMYSLTDHSERVKYYVRMTLAMNLEPSAFFAGDLNIPNSNPEKRRKPVYKRWGLSDWREGNKAINHRLYFTEFFVNYGRLDHILGVKIESFDELVAEYFRLKGISDIPERFQQVAIDFTQQRIDDYQARINEWAAKKQMTIDVKSLFDRATSLVENELLGISTLKWEAFHRADQLEPFALLWDITKYKLYLRNL